MRIILTDAESRALLEMFAKAVEPTTANLQKLVAEAPVPRATSEPDLRAIAERRLDIGAKQAIGTELRKAAMRDRMERVRAARGKKPAKQKRTRKAKELPQAQLHVAAIAREQAQAHAREEISGVTDIMRGKGNGEQYLAPESRDTLIAKLRTIVETKREACEQYLERAGKETFLLLSDAELAAAVQELSTAKASLV